MSRKKLETATRFNCIVCKKNITYYENNGGLEALNRRITKSGKTMEAFKSEFMCTACARAARIAAKSMSKAA